VTQRSTFESNTCGWRRFHFEAGHVPRTYRVEDFAQALRAIGEPIHSRTADQISMAKLLTILFEITALFEMTTRIELVMLQKTMGGRRRRGAQTRSSTQHVVDGRAVVGAWIAGNRQPPRSRLESRAEREPLRKFASDRGLSNTTTFLAIAISLTRMAILWHHWRQ
jgi:ubiquinone biosynthesis protein